MLDVLLFIFHVSRLLNPYLQLVLTVALVTVAEILLKQGTTETATVENTDWLGLSSLPSPRVWMGAALLALSSGTWILVLRKMQLYLAFTLSSVVHVTIPVASWLVLGEQIHAVRWTGITLLLAGIWIIARPATRAEERP
jgi:multidrug transporter EmrE-like cation transporter